MILSYHELPALRHETTNLPIFLKAGCFDLFHEGHLDILDFLKSLGGISVVGVSPDSRVRQRKGPGRPIRNESLRIQDVEASGLADYTFPVPDGVFGLPRSIYRLKPDAFVEKRADSIGINTTTALLKLAGVQYIVCDRPKICSTTEIIARQVYSTIGTPAFIEGNDAFRMSTITDLSGEWVKE